MWRYENYYQSGSGKNTAIYGRFDAKNDALKAAQDTLNKDPFKKGWTMAQILDRKTGRVCACVEV